MAVTHLSEVDAVDHDGSTLGFKLAGTLVTATAAEINILDGVTATAAEINKLDGVAVTAAEIDQRALSFAMTLGTATSQFVVIPWACSVSKAYTCIDGALATADEVLTLKNHAGTSLTSGAITIAQSGSAAGDIDSATPSANNTFTAGQKLEVATDGGNSNAATATITVLVDIT